MECVTIVSFSIKFNGELLNYFQPTRGLRQGDPLSPYLFILMANALSNLIHQALNMEHLKGIQFNRFCTTLSHFFFADDAIFFLDAKLMDCQNLSNIISQYCLATGHEVNRNKSGVFFSRDCPMSLQENLANELRVPLMIRTGKYLGIPSDWGR